MPVLLTYTAHVAHYIIALTSSRAISYYAVMEYVPTRALLFAKFHPTTTTLPAS